MIFTDLPLKGAYIIEPAIHSDNRGSFYRFYCKETFKQIGHVKDWVQMNHSYTAEKGTVRGMHYQLPPHSEIKFLRCIAGRILDVIVDLRESSPTFLQWTSVELSAENRKMIYIPEGFAHGFQTLTSDCELIYHHSANYTSGFEGGIRFDDPLTGIRWPLPVSIISERDNNHPFLTNTFKGIKL